MTAPWRRYGLAAVLLAGVLAFCAVPRPLLPVPDHIVIVMLENHGFAEIVEGGNAPFIHGLAERGALFTHSYALMHPSEPWRDQTIRPVPNIVKASN